MQIIPYTRNAKKHSPEQIRLIASSIRDFGWQQPIKVGKGGVIIVGHGRFEAYQAYKDEYGLNEPWVIDESGQTVSGAPETRKLSEIEEKDYRLRDNKIAESEMNMDLLLPELLELSEAGVDIALTGFDPSLIKVGNAITDTDDIYIDPDKMAVIEVFPPEAPRLKEKFLMICDSKEDYDLLKAALEEKKLSSGDIVALLQKK